MLSFKMRMRMRNRVKAVPPPKNKQTMKLYKRTSLNDILAMEEDLIQWRHNKETSGSSQSLPTALSHFYQQEYTIAKDSWKKEMDDEMEFWKDIDIGRLSSILKEPSDWLQSEKSTENIMPNLLAHQQPKIMSGKKRRVLPVPVLNWEANLNGIAPTTGLKFTTQQWQEICSPSLKMSSSDAIQVSKRLPQKMQNLNPLKRKSSSIVEEQALVKVEELGKKQRGMLTQKVQPLNSGMDIVGNSTWSLTNFGDKLKCPTCYVGLTDIQYLLKLKAVRKFSKVKKYGLRRICIQKIGTQGLMKEL